jgi:hypothetical protein
MNGTQIDRLCFDWLRENYGPQIASKYTRLSLMVPMWSPHELIEALETMRHVLSAAFGSHECFGSTGYDEARRKLGLKEDAPIPEVFVRAFAEPQGRGSGVCWQWPRYRKAVQESNDRRMGNG